jgi:threonine dehydrogenase-like Zn-dependent dehydrogenase
LYKNAVHEVHACSARGQPEGDPLATTNVKAMVQVGPRAMELTELARPTIGDDEALIRVEACGICGSDIHMYDPDPTHGGAVMEFPVIRGHEPVGVVEEIGADAARRHRLVVGDRVAVDPFLRCGSCRYCLGGKGELCVGGASQHNTYAMIPLAVGSGLWGGFATHLVATAQTVLYKVPAHVPATRAALFNVLGAGVKWCIDVGGATLGSSVVVLGSGQRGISCAVSALEVGAEFVAVTGLSADAHKLAVATELGVHEAIDVERDDPVQVVLDRYESGVDLVIDTTPGYAGAIGDALAMVRTGGRIVLAGTKGRPVDGVALDQVIRKEVTIHGVLGTGADHYRRAVAMIATTDLPLELLQTHVFPLEQVEHGIQLLAGEVVDDRPPLNIVIEVR